jgi:hypothetical protein
MRYHAVPLAAKVLVCINKLKRQSERFQFPGKFFYKLGLKQVCKSF